MTKEERGQRGEGKRRERTTEGEQREKQMKRDGKGRWRSSMFSLFSLICLKFSPYFPLSPVLSGSHTLTSVSCPIASQSRYNTPVHCKLTYRTRVHYLIPPLSLLTTALSCRICFLLWFLKRRNQSQVWIFRLSETNCRCK